MTSSTMEAENGFSSLSLNEPLQLPHVTSQVAPYELVELLYDGHTLSTNNKTTLVSTSQEHVKPVGKSRPPSLSSYKCDGCKREFKEASHFAKHKRGLLCQKLSKKISRKNNKKKLINQQDKRLKNPSLPYKPYQCNLCGAKFCDQGNVELHLERSHRTKHPMWMENVKVGGTFSCNQCHLWFSDRQQLRMHQNQHHHPATHSSEPPPPPLQPPLNLPPPPACNPPYFSQPNYVPNYESTSAVSSNPISMPLPSMPSQVAMPMQTNSYISPVSTQSLPSIPHMPPPPHSQAMNPPSSSMCAPNSNIQPVNHEVQSSTSVSKGSKSIKGDKCCSSTWNVCGDCGHKFLDIINLELHLVKSHPTSKITLAVHLGSGCTLYQTNNSKKCNKGLLSNLEKSIQEKSSNYENCACKQSLEVPDQKRSTRYKKSCMEVGDGKNIQCASCLKLFSEPEFSLHNSKDKNALCGICSFSSCSDSQVAIHMYTCHKDSLPCPLRSSLDKINLSQPVEDKESPSSHTSNHNGQLKSPESAETLLVDKRSSIKISCRICTHETDSGALLAEHLHSHGRLEIQCCKCKETYEGIIELSKHVIASHSNQVVRLKVSLTLSQDPILYVILVCPFVASEILRRASECGTIGQISDDANPVSENNNTISSHSESLYACSACGAYLTGTLQLQSHLVLHQDMSDPLASPSVSHSIEQTSVLQDKDTLEFRCEECGFWSQESHPVIRHIQGIHMSGNMFHVRKVPSGQVQATIHVFTPISPMVSS